MSASHADWVRWMTNAGTARKAAHERYLTTPYHWLNPICARICEEAEVVYENAVLLAWDTYRPDGPLVGEVLPVEVERITKKRSAS